MLWTALDPFCQRRNQCSEFLLTPLTIPYFALARQYCGRVLWLVNLPRPIASGGGNISSPPSEEGVAGESFSSAAIAELLSDFATPHLSSQLRSGQPLNYGLQIFKLLLD